MSAQRWTWRTPSRPERVRFTVFTPTFNRAHTLARPYESLCAQQYRDFEWLIVDDGSTDGTRELVAGWQAAGRLTIRYLWQENGGKHRAFNRGVREAQGELFVPLDSDDWCTPEALARFDAHWSAIPPARKALFSGVGCLCRDEAGEIVGAPFPASPLDASLFALLRAQQLVGEKWGCHRTDLLKAEPFPEFPGEKFVPEALVWNRLARGRLMRFVNEPLRVYADSGDGLTASLLRVRCASPQGTRLYYREAAGLPLGARARVMAWLNYGRFAAHAGVSSQTCWQETGSPAGALARLLGAALAWRDRRRGAGEMCNA